MRDWDASRGALLPGLRAGHDLRCGLGRSLCFPSALGVAFRKSSTRSCPIGHFPGPASRGREFPWRAAGRAVRFRLAGPACPWPCRLCLQIPAHSPASPLGIGCKRPSAGPPSASAGHRHRFSFRPPVGAFPTLVGLDLLCHLHGGLASGGRTGQSGDHRHRPDRSFLHAPGGAGQRGAQPGLPSLDDAGSDRGRLPLLCPSYGGRLERPPGQDDTVNSPLFESSENVASRRPRIRVAVALVEHGRVLLVRHVKGERTYWLLPGGGLEFGESLADGARREMLEETGIIVEVGDLLFAAETLPPDRSRHLIHLVFAARRAGGVLKVGEEPRLAEAKFVDTEQLRDLVLHPPMKEPLAALLVGGVHPPTSFLGNLWVD
ncbi:NUDIX hydrolase [bacterium CPR1]|nr:NUDIX hydrolase [bacterium CPR1]